MRHDKSLINLIVYSISYSIKYILKDGFDFKSFYLIESYKLHVKLQKLKI